MLSITMLSITMLSITMLNSVMSLCWAPQCWILLCRYAEHRNAEFCYVVMLSIPMLNIIIPNGMGLKSTMTFRDFPWLSVTFRDFPWLSVTFRDFPWLSVTFRDFPWKKWKTLLGGALSVMLNTRMWVFPWDSIRKIKSWNCTTEKLFLGERWRALSVLIIPKCEFFLGIVLGK